PSAQLESAAVNTVPAATQNLYDGMGRVTDALSVKFGDEQWRTRTVYEGDRTTVIPPKGGTAATTVTDALGRTTELLQYTNTARTASQKTTYTYGKYDDPTKVTDPSGNTWTYTFDLRGQKTKADDPDKGTVTTTYDDLGRPVTTTDDRGITLTTVYDALGRKTAVKQGDTVLAEWTFDTLAKGQLTSSTLPAQAGGLAGTYTWTYGYKAETGALLWTLNPALGNIPAERVTTNYNSDDQPYRTSGERGALVGNTQYDVFSRTERIEFSATLG